jgi:regulatory protein
VGLLDDERFAAEVVEHAVGVRRLGKRAIGSALASKGVDRGTIERALALVPGQEEARAMELAVDRARHLASLPPQAAYRRLTSFLLRRGYDPAVARHAAERALRVDEGHE